MPRPPSPSIPEKEFVYGALKESLRLDGRAMLEMRAPMLTFGPELGWVECSLGKTRYVTPRPGSCLEIDSMTRVPLQRAGASRWEDGEAAAGKTARGHHNNTLGALIHGVQRVRTRSVGS